MGTAPKGRQWMSYLMPLPHEIAIDGETSVAPAEIGVRLRAGAGEIERQAAAELEALFVDRAGTRPTGSSFEILVGVTDGQGQLDGTPIEGVDRLTTLPNREQAYVIHPVGDDRLVLAAAGERGVSYAVRTLIQLLEATLSRDDVTIPLARVIDWPDMDERGMWNFPDPDDWIPWMSSLKLNYGKMAATELATVERGKPNRATIDAGLMETGRLRAFNYVPYIVHLNFLHDAGLFRAYPELAGKGDGALAGRYPAHKQGNQHRAPCASNPLLQEILAEWMAQIASQGAPEVSCWLSERPAQCGCDSCTAVGQFVLESRAFTRAWQQVRKQYPDLGIRIFLSTTTLERDHQVLAELPAEAKIERACATALERVLHLPRDLAVNPLYDHCAAEGRWIASYDVPIGANGAVDTPEFKVPQRSAHRIRDYVGQLVRRRYSGAYGMMAWSTQGREICGYNISALAEWSWNLGGRTEREFALAWATREGYGDPEAVAEWAELMGPVEFDVYDSDFPSCYSRGKALAMVREGQRPVLGEGMFRYYGSAAEFEEKSETCRRALTLAGRLGEGDLAAESRVVLAYVELAGAIYNIAEHVSTRDLPEPGEQEALQGLVASLVGAGKASADAIRAWRGALGPEPWAARVHDAIAGSATAAQEIARHVSERYLT